MIESIQNKLTEIEDKHFIKILYACESGSRAWGFSSSDSDYDVRFIYKFPRNSYLSINEPKDQIDLPINDILDVNGWDLRKTLRLFAGSNAALFEWLQSPVVYRSKSEFIDAIKPLMTEYYSLRKGIHHYIGIATNTFGSLQGDEVGIKKSFYCVRSLLAAMWIVQKQEFPPMEFGVLRTIVDNVEWNAIIDKMLKIKSTANEKSLIPNEAVIHNFIEENLAKCNEDAGKLESKDHNLENLNILFRNLINEF